MKQSSHDLKVDQKSKFDTIWSTLNEIRFTAEELRTTISANRSNFVGPSREETSAGGFNETLSSQHPSLPADQVDVLSEGIANLTFVGQEMEDAAKEQAVLKSLSFSSRQVRHENVPIAHEQTFMWTIAPPRELEEEPEGQFRTWLRLGDGVFWVSGKAGCGKSTLMKFLADHNQVRSFLDEWAGQAELVTAAHYFWCAGSPMQKSYEGLYRTLLYEIFCKCPRLIPQLCPHVWMQTDLLPSKADWSTAELRDMLRALPECGDLPTRYFFFIDGIDEFDGDHFELCKILSDLARYPNIKLCLASRPWNIFADVFGNDPRQKICMEDLTRTDILRFTEGQLASHPRWGLHQFRPKDKQFIIDSITAKAQGVFLWVFLVTRSLRDGLTNGDTMLELRDRLESLPVDLKRFFKHMLNGVDSIYHEKMAAFLSIARNAKQPLDSFLYSMYEKEYEDENYALNMASNSISDDEMDQLHVECQRRINARCGGLLEVRSGSVQFLHRTVRDFLLTSEMSEYLKKKVKPAFSANLSTLRAFVAFQKHIFYSTGNPKAITSLGILQESLQYASDAIEDSPIQATELLDDLEGLFQPSLEGGEILPDLKPINELDVVYNDGETNFYIDSPGFLFRKELLRAGVSQYVSGKLEESPHYFDDLSEPPLSVILQLPKLTSRHVQMVSDFLETGQDPEDKRMSILFLWMSVIMRTCQGEETTEKFHTAIESGLFSLLLRCIRHTCLGDNDINQTTDPNDGTMLRDPKIIWGNFLHALFSRYPRYPHKSLRLLEEFLRLPICASLCCTILSTLQEVLKTTGPQAHRVERLRFLAKCTEMVVQTGVLLDWQMEFLSYDIYRALPRLSSSRILHIVNRTEQSQLTCRKRKAADDLDRLSHTYRKTR